MAADRRRFIRICTLFYHLRAHFLLSYYFPSFTQLLSWWWWWWWCWFYLVNFLSLLFLMIMIMMIWFCVSLDNQHDMMIWGRIGEMGAFVNSSFTSSFVNQSVYHSTLSVIMWMVTRNGKLASGDSPLSSNFNHLYSFWLCDSLDILVGIGFLGDVNFLFHFWLNGFVGYFWEVSMFNIERLFLLLSLIRVFLVSWVDEILPLYL